MLAKGVAWHGTGYLALFGWERVLCERRGQASRKKKNAVICEQRRGKE